MTKSLSISFTAFVRTVLNVVLTLGQRVIGKIAYDGIQPNELEGAERERADEIFGEVETVPAIARAVFAAVCGARSGKSYILGALRLLHLVLTVPLTTLAPGEMAAAVIVAPDLRLARQTLRFVLGAAKSAASIAKRIEAVTSDSFIIRRPDGARVEIVCLPATRGGSALRGRSLVCALLDEAAFFRDAESIVNDVEILKAVAPRILPGGQVLVLSTPWLEAGVLFDLHKANFGDPQNALVAHAPTIDMRDDEHTKNFVRREYMRDVVNADREFGAKFIAGGTQSLIEPVSITQAVDESRPLITYARPGMVQAAATDLALVNDASAAAIAGRVGEQYEILEIAELRPRSGAPLKLSTVIDSFAEVFGRHRIKSFHTDVHLREAAKEFAQKHKLHIYAAPSGNQQNWEIFSLLAKLFAESRIKMARYPRLQAQLQAVVAKPLPGGGFRIHSPRRQGSHGDVLSAVALAVWAASKASSNDGLLKRVRNWQGDSRYAGDEGGRGIY